MKVNIIFIALSIVPFLGCSQSDRKVEIENRQKKIVQAIGDLDKISSVNYLKHINQVEGYKDGIWIESTNGNIWFINYKMGLKEGVTSAYYLSGQKYLEANYSKGIITGVMTFYDTKGGLLQVNSNIRLNDSIVIRDLERAEGGNIYFSKEPHKFMYSADVKSYTSSGEIYAVGKLLFDDDWAFTGFKIGTWVDPRDQE
jgi:antitoxin component YwqK of YwqJK toxin-antitoxin module